MAVSFDDIHWRHDLITYHEKHGSGHYFEPSTMRFFDSRVLERVIHDGAGKVYFVTSERFDSRSPRLYSVRSMNSEGSIDTVGKFQEYGTAKQAQGVIKRLCSKGAVAS